MTTIQVGFEQVVWSARQTLKQLHIPFIRSISSVSSIDSQPYPRSALSTMTTTTDTTPPTLPMPHPTLTKIHGQPAALSIRLLKTEVYANAMSISTTLGGGSFGYLGVAMPATEYKALTGTAPFGSRAASQARP